MTAFGIKSQGKEMAASQPMGRLGTPRDMAGFGACSCLLSSLSFLRLLIRSRSHSFAFHPSQPGLRVLIPLRVPRAPNWTELTVIRTRSPLPRQRRLRTHDGRRAPARRRRVGVSRQGCSVGTYGPRCSVL